VCIRERAVVLGRNSNVKEFAVVDVICAKEFVNVISKDLGRCED